MTVVAGCAGPVVPLTAYPASVILSYVRNRGRMIPRWCRLRTNETVGSRCPEGCRFPTVVREDGKVTLTWLINAREPNR